MSQKSFLDNKKSQKNFPYVGRGGGVNQHMENSICFVVFIFESFPKLPSNKDENHSILLNQALANQCWLNILTHFSPSSRRLLMPLYSIKQKSQLDTKTRRQKFSLKKCSGQYLHN